MRLTPVVALAVLLACLPGQAMELIELQPDPALDPTAYPVPYSPAYPIDPLAAEEWRETPFVAGLSVLRAEPVAMPAAIVPATPVPEPVSVLMMACGLLLMVPGAWAVRWSRLGDSERLLQRRFP
ncbi:hypothetical protein [Pseudoduganella umbonata]|uniref:Uncharacterized protein n=1 Tax=Pseudoduganella umbonata TaxID=864828 RepID=A0A4P8HQY3_9BURK|nr:hypothetical protein [Pseudoduganella umbonata]MBB3220237.1 hypothetical protein [Pseudoduganella umbonata]QCP12217.1 hypothetical protein FCL38_18640 [Pseudoduganella umbonata]